MNETKLGFFPRLFYSMSSFDKYRLFLRQSTGKAVVYLLLLTILLALAVYIPAGLEFNRIIDDVIANIGTKVPDFSLAGGRLEVSGKMPIVIDDGAYPIVIDTTPGAEDKILNQYDIVILITSDKIIQKNFVDKSVTDLSAFQGMVLTRDSIVQALPVMKPVGIFVFIFIGIFFICGKFISALIVSLIGLIINSAKKTGLSYRSIFKISVYSMTLPLLICTIPGFFTVHIPFIWLLFYIISSVYVYGAINSIRKEIDNMNMDNMNDPGDMDDLNL